MMKSVRDSFLRFWRKGLRGILMGHQSSNQYLKGMEDLTKDVMWDVLSRLDFKTVSCCHKNPSLMINDTTFHQLGRLKWIEIQDKVVEVEKEQLVDVVTIHDVGLSNQRFLGPFPDFEVIIGSSVNGLICVWNASGNTYIVNPIAKQYLTLPDHQSCSLDLVVRSVGSGFGSLDDASYKVIRIFRRYLTRAYEDKIIQIKVLTLGTNNWRVLEPNVHLNNIRDYIGYGLFFNGHVHWINGGGHQLFVFELDNETFNLFPSPPFEGEEKRNYYGILGVLKGCLSQGCYYSCNIFTVWVMKQHGNKDSWYKAFSIKEIHIARKLSCPVCLLDGLKGGTLIANAGNKLVAYCLRTNTLRTINLTSSPSNTRYPARPVRTVNIQSVITYHPTFLNLQNFVSPNTLVQNF
nr:hypothetical protein [Tanacetum cinerariifolium]